MKNWKHSCRSSVIGLGSYPSQYQRSSAPLTPLPLVSSPPPSFPCPYFFLLLLVCLIIPPLVLFFCVYMCVSSYVCVRVYLCCFSRFCFFSRRCIKIRQAVAGVFNLSDSNQCHLISDSPNISKEFGGTIFLRGVILQVQYTVNMYLVGRHLQGLRVGIFMYIFIYTYVYINIYI